MPLLLGACGRAPDGIVELAVDDPHARWFHGEFVQMVPPVHMPSPRAHRDEVEVWLHTDAIDLVEGGTDTARLRFVGATVADRIEWTGEGDARRIVDVRGTELGADGSCAHHVLRPVDETPEAALFGLAWPCDEPTAQAWVDDHMRERLAAMPPFVRMPDERRAQALDGFVQRNDCDGCHIEGRADADRIGAYGAVSRGTDASGFFAPQSVLRDEMPLEAYGAFDRNTTDPSISVRCAVGEPTLEEARPGVHRWRCADRQVPRARVDWAVLARTDRARLDQICEARRHLVDALGDAAGAFERALDPCA